MTNESIKLAFERMYQHLQNNNGGGENFYVNLTPNESWSGIYSLEVPFAEIKQAYNQNKNIYARIVQETEEENITLLLPLALFTESAIMFLGFFIDGSLLAIQIADGDDQFMAISSSISIATQEDLEQHTTEMKEYINETFLGGSW